MEVAWDIGYIFLELGRNLIRINWNIKNQEQTNFVNHLQHCIY